MGSRIRENPSKVFECFLEVAASNGSSKEPWVLQRFPDSYREQEVLKLVPHFCYPCEIECTVVQVFSFVLTGADGKWTFGYCRHTPNASTALCVLSSLPWHETFYDLLNRIAEITQREEVHFSCTGCARNDGRILKIDKENMARDLIEFLEALHSTEVPDPGGELLITYGRHEYTFHCSDHTKLPSIPENRNVTEYFNAIDAQNMMIIFASMLNERRVMITSKKLSRLSACVQSANALIYPMFWQHIFIPVLPYKLIDYLSAPMPFLIGVPALVLEKATKLDLSEVVILYADDNRVETPFDDFQCLPPEVVSSLKKRLKNSTAMLGDKVSRAFLHSLVQLIGGYSDALNYGPGSITFNHDAFIQTRTPSMQPFLQRMLHLQIFHQFIEDRLEMLNSGEGFKDEFEVAVSAYADKNSTKMRNQYRDWMTNVKKEGGALLKSVKNKANPAMKHAYKSVKDRSKKAYKGMRSKFQELQQKDNASDSMPVRNSAGSKTPLQPRSAPSSPTLVQRPVTFHGLKSVNTSRSSSNIKLSHNDGDSSTALTPRQYNLLEANHQAVNRDTASESDAGIPSQNSSPNLSMTRISMDLMGDLQDIIFRRCSVGDSSSNEPSTLFSSPTSFTPNCNVDGTIPIPPPRTKKRGVGCPSSTKPAHQRPSSPENVDSNQKTAAAPQEPLLIQLDAEETAEEIFDPLLAKENKQTTKTTPPPPPHAVVPNTKLNSVQLYPVVPTAHSLGFQSVSNATYVTNCSPGLRGSSPNMCQQAGAYNQMGFMPYPTIVQTSAPIASQTLPPTLLPTYVPSLSTNPFQANVGTAMDPNFPHQSQIPNSSTNPFAHFHNAGGFPPQNPAIAQQFQNPFQDSAQPKSLKAEVNEAPVADGDPFSSLLQWDGGTNAAANKLHWETFN